MAIFISSAVGNEQHSGFTLVLTSSSNNRLVWLSKVFGPDPYRKDKEVSFFTLPGLVLTCTVAE